MSRYFDRLLPLTLLYRLLPVAGRVGIVLVAVFCTATVASAQAWSQDCCNPGCNCCGQVNAAALAAPPCGVCSYARIWLKPGCIPPSFCQFRCNDSTHIWDGYSNQQSEKLNRQLARQLYHLQKQHIARGWPWYGGFHGQQPCPGFGPDTIGAGGMAGGPYTPVPNSMPLDGAGQAEAVSGEAVEGIPVEEAPARKPPVKKAPEATPERSTLNFLPTEPARSLVTPLPPVETTQSGGTNAAKSS